LLVSGYWLILAGEDIRVESKSYRDLEIYQLSRALAMRIHFMSLRLPKYEQYEESSQIRKSSKGVSSCIAEGYGRRYKNEFIKFLIYAQASCDETEVHLDFIHESGYLNDNDYDTFVDENEKFGRKINVFMQYVENQWNWRDHNEERETSNQQRVMR
jgi:four helix bundle protein